MYHVCVCIIIIPFSSFVIETLVLGEIRLRNLHLETTSMELSECSFVLFKSRSWNEYQITKCSHDHLII